MKNNTNSKKHLTIIAVAFLIGVFSLHSTVYAQDDAHARAQEGWNGVTQSIILAQEGAVINYNAPGDSNFVSHSVFQHLSGRNITLILKRNGEIWEFNGNNLKGFNVNQNQYYQTLAALGYRTGTYYVENLGVSPPVNTQKAPITPPQNNTQNNENTNNIKEFSQYK